MPTLANTLKSQELPVSFKIFLAWELELLARNRFQKNRKNRKMLKDHLVKLGTEDNQVTRSHITCPSHFRSHFWSGSLPQKLLYLGQVLYYVFSIYYLVFMPVI